MKNIFPRKMLTVLKNAYASPVFWIRLGVLGVWLIAVQLYFMSQKDFSVGTVPVYVEGGNIDADVRGCVDVDDVNATVSVEVENSVHVYGTVSTW